MYNLSKIGTYLRANHPGCKGQAVQKGAGAILQEWDEKSDGPAPTPEQVAAWRPPAADPDKAPAPSLEIREYKTLVAAIDAATTVAGVKAVFRQYLLKRAGL